MARIQDAFSKDYTQICIYSIRKEISPRYTPVQWMKSMTVVILEMSLFVTAVVYLEGWLLSR